MKYLQIQWLSFLQQFQKRIHLRYNRQKYFLKNNSMKKSMQKQSELRIKEGLFTNGNEFNDTFKYQNKNRMEYSLKPKQRSKENVYAEQSSRKSGSLSQLSSTRTQKYLKHLDFNVQKLKKMFPFAQYNQPKPEKTKKISSDSTLFPVINKTSKLQKNTKNASLSSIEPRSIEVPKIISTSKNFKASCDGQNNAYYYSEGGLLGTKKKINQDHPIIKFQLPLGVNIIGVCDGHGLNGHLVSSFISERLISNFKEFLQTANQPVNIKQVGEKVYFNTNNQLIKASGINVNLSGSTVVSVVSHNKKLYCFNVGDSRIILCSNNNGKWSCKPLSDDQKPSRLDQKARVIKFGGRVQAQKDENNRPLGPLRVWMAKQQIPGLAMTRAFGDTIGVKAGVIGIPQILQYEVKVNDSFVAAASDGVWEYLSNQQVMNILVPFYCKGNLKQGCEQVVKRSMSLWKKFCMSRDDITIVASQIAHFCPS